MSNAKLKVTSIINNHNGFEAISTLASMAEHIDDKKVIVDDRLLECIIQTVKANFRGSPIAHDAQSFHFVLNKIAGFGHSLKVDLATNGEIKNVGYINLEIVPMYFPAPRLDDIVLSKIIDMGGIINAVNSVFPDHLLSYEDAKQYATKANTEVRFNEEEDAIYFKVELLDLGMVVTRCYIK